MLSGYLITLSIIKRNDTRKVKKPSNRIRLYLLYNFKVFTLPPYPTSSLNWLYHTPLSVSVYSSFFTLPHLCRNRTGFVFCYFFIFVHIKNDDMPENERQWQPWHRACDGIYICNVVEWYQWIYATCCEKQRGRKGANERAKIKSSITPAITTTTCVEHTLSKAHNKLFNILSMYACMYMKFADAYAYHLNCRM